MDPMTLVINLIFRGIELGLSRNVITDKLQALRDAKGSDLTPQEFADEMEQMCDAKSKEARDRVNAPR